MEKPHRKLDLWNLSMELVVAIFEKTEAFPKDQRYGLVDQIRRAAVSIPSNVAEGAARQTRKEFANFLHIAQGSASELDTQLELARRLGYLNATDWQPLDRLLERVDKMLSGLIRRQKQTEGGKRQAGAGPLASRLSNEPNGESLSD